MSGTRKLVVEILGDAKGFAGAVDEAGGKLASFGKSVGKVALGAGVALGGLAAAAVPMVNAASDLAETQSKVGVIFGAASKDIEKFADTAAKSLGQSKNQAMNAAATFATFGKGAGLAGKPLATFATDMTTLASDLASFNNTSPEQAIEAIGAALRGESEPIRSYGVLLDDATLRNEALKLGLIKTTKEALTPANKVLAAQAAIMSQTKDAQGDFARTSDGLANKQRILSAQLENVKAKIGTALLPVALKLATLFGDKVIPIIERLADRLQGPLTQAFQRVAVFMRNDVAPIMEKVFGWLRDNVPPVLDAIAKYANEVLLPAMQTAFGWLRDNVPPVLDAVAKFVQDHVIPALKRLGGWVQENLVPALQKLWASFKEEILPVLRDLAEFVGTKVLPVLAKIGQWIAEKVLPIIGEFVVFVLEDLIPAFFKVVNFISEEVIPKLADFAKWFKDLPGNIKEAFLGLADTITEPFRAAFGAIARLWNNTAGKLSFETPDWVPGIGGKGWSMPKIDGYHTGGMFRAPNPGGVGLALLRDGERVSTPGMGGGTSQPIIVEIGGQPILNALLKLDRQNGGTPLRVRAT